MFGQNSLLTSRTRRWRKVNEQNRQGWGGRLNDVLRKANVERSESRYTKPAEGWLERGVFSIAISNHRPWWSLYYVLFEFKPTEFFLLARLVCVMMTSEKGEGNY